MIGQVWVSTHMSLAYSTQSEPALVYLQFHDDDGEIFAVQQIPAEQIEELIETLRRAAAEAHTATEMGRAEGTA